LIKQQQGCTVIDPGKEGKAIGYRHTRITSVRTLPRILSYILVLLQIFLRLQT